MVGVFLMLKHRPSTASIVVDASKGNMWSYKICGYAFDSNVPIPELGLAHELQPAFTFQLCADPKDFSASCTWLNDWYSLDGTIWLAFARFEAGYLLRFPELADFVVSTDARAVCCYPQA